MPSAGWLVVPRESHSTAAHCCVCTRIELLQAPLSQSVGQAADCPVGWRLGVSVVCRDSSTNLTPCRPLNISPMLIRHSTIYRSPAPAALGSIPSSPRPCNIRITPRPSRTCSCVLLLRLALSAHLHPAIPNRLLLRSRNAAPRHDSLTRIHTSAAAPDFCLRTSPSHQNAPTRASLSSPTIL